MPRHGSDFLRAVRSAVPAFLLLALLLVPRLALAGGGPAETVVLVNTQSTDSVRVAAAYVAARGVPPQQVCEVRCTSSLDVPMADYVRDVVDPLREFLRRRDLERRVCFVVMTQGMPIRARTPGGDVSTAAVLSLLDTPLAGMDQTRMPQVGNPYREGPAPRDAIAGGGRFLLVTALLSATADEALALVQRSVASDGTAPKDALFVYQDANPAAHVRNEAYDAARARVEALGMRTEHVKVGPKEATDRKRVMGYMAGGVYSALTAEGVASNEYLPGAISDHLQSFGAVPQNFDLDPKKHSQFSICHLVRAGVTGVHGAVAEPYNVAFPDAGMFETYLRGFTLAETFHRHQPLAYWMNLVLGDPLCAPYADRPKVTLSDEGGTIRATAPGAVRIEVFVDGRPVASADGDTVTASLDLAAHTGDSHHVLAQATGPGAAEPRGWATMQVASRTPAPVSQAPAPTPVPARAAAWKADAEVAGDVTAGDTFAVRIRPRDALGAVVAAWKGRVEVRLAAPPVRVAKIDVETVPEGGIEVPVRLTKAGDVDLVVTLPDDGARAVARVRVVAGPPHHATSPLDRVPVGQACDVDVVVEDEFGNRADFEGELKLVVPTDPFATLPSPVRLAKGDRGRAVFRDVVLTRAGRHGIVLADGTGKLWSQPTEGIEAVHAPLRTWLVSQPFRGEDAARAFSSDPAATADRDGCVAGGTLWRRLRPRGDDVPLPAPATKDGDAVAAVTFLRVLNASKVRLLGAGAARTVVFLDGRPVFDGSPKAADPRGKREPLAAEVALAEGLHRLTVVTTRKDRAAFALEIDDGAGKHVDSVTAVAAISDDVPPKFVASGRVRRGNGGVAGAKVHVKGSDGQERDATTAADGVWFVDGLPAGDVEVRAEWKHPLSPSTRTATLDERHATDLDFVAEDKSPPAVRLEVAQPRFARQLVLEPKVEDDDAVREVRLLLDGTEVAKLTSAPWRFGVDVGMKARGRHEVVVTAVDPAGNEGRSAPLAVTFVDDTKGPVVKVTGLANNAQVKKKTTVTVAATDDLPVGSVQFRLDGKDVGAPRTSAPYECEIDPAALAEGPHALAIVARDVDGNETLVEVKFRVTR
jgi:uncharacterized protein (TIGR03790 family)